MFVKYLAPLLIVLLAAGTSGRPALGAPNPLEIPPEALESGLLPVHVKQISARIDGWIRQIIDAKAENAILGARRGLSADYQAYDSTEYRYTYAREAAQLVAKSLKAGLNRADTLRQLKEINLALAISSLRQVTIQPALEVMVRNANPAVRYAGWNGYRGIRSLLLAQGGRFRKTMFDTLDARAAKEESTAVIGGILKMLNIPSWGVEAVSPEDIAEAQKTALAVLVREWDRWCRLVLTGDAEMASAASNGIDTLRTFAYVFADDQDRMNLILQATANMMWCSGKVYDMAGTKGLLAGVNVLLLLNCEESANAISKLRESWIRNALTDRKVADRGAVVRLAVLKWIDELKKLGVKEPNFKTPADETSPPAAS